MSLKFYTMKLNRSLVVSLVLTIFLSAVYRAMPNRPWGFAPQFAIALFAGAIFVKDKKWAFALPLISMFISDLLYQFLYNKGLTEIPGFYKGQWVNYLLFTSLTIFGFMVRSRKPLQVLGASIATPTTFFLISNFMVWAGGGGLKRPKTFEGLMMCYNDALPFYANSLMATAIFSAILFGGYYFLNQSIAKKNISL